MQENSLKVMKEHDGWDSFIHSFIHSLNQLLNIYSVRFPGLQNKWPQTWCPKNNRSVFLYSCGGTTSKSKVWTGLSSLRKIERRTFPTSLDRHREGRVKAKADPAGVLPQPRSARSPQKREEMRTSLLEPSGDFDLGEYLSVAVSHLVCGPLWCNFLGSSRESSLWPHTTSQLPVARHAVERTSLPSRLLFQESGGARHGKAWGAEEDKDALKAAPCPHNPVVPPEPGEGPLL